MSATVVGPVPVWARPTQIQVEPPPADHTLPAEPPSSENPPPTDAEIMLDPSAARAARVEAAIRLIESSILSTPPDEPPPLNDHPVVLALESGDPTLEAIVLEALPRLTRAPRALWHAVSPLADADSPHDPRLLTAAIASFRTPDSAQTLLRLCDPGVPGTLREAAGARAGELLGISPATPDAAWAWWLERRDWPRIRWADHISSVLASSVRAERARAETAERRLLVASRRLWGSLPEADRPAMLDEFLASEIDPLRLLAIELIREQIASGRSIPDSTTGIAIAQLASPRAPVRADAAMLLAQIAPPEAASSVLIALLAETDPRAAEHLLIASARWPTPEGVEPVLRWLSQRGATAIAAGDAAYALHRQGLLAAHVDRLLPALRSLDDASINGGACRLLVELGDQSDMDRVIALLGAQRPTLRLAAANALIHAPQALQSLLAAAAIDANLADAAIRAVLRHARDESGVLALDALPAVRAADAQREILAELPLQVALELTHRVTDDPCRLAGELRVIFAKHAADAPLNGGTEPADPEDTANALPERPIEHVERLARAELDCGDAERALAALAGVAPERLSDAARHTLARALIRLGRLDEAWAHAQSPDLWMSEVDALHAGEAPPDKLHAIARFILEHLGGSLGDEASRSLAALISSDAPATGDAPPPAEPQTPGEQQAPGGPPAGASEGERGGADPRD